MSLMVEITLEIFFWVIGSIVMTAILCSLHETWVDVHGKFDSVEQHILWYVFARLLLLCWLLATITLAGHTWVKIAGIENVPQWAVTLFKTEGK